MHSVRWADLNAVAQKLDGLPFKYAFTGGVVVELLVDSPISPHRPTKDVDVIVEVVTFIRYADLEDHLRQAGFSHDMRLEAPLCRWTLGELIVDIMPTDGTSIGLKTNWFAIALEGASRVRTGLIFGRSTIVSEIATASSNLRHYVASSIQALFAIVDFRDALPAHLPGNSIGQAQLPQLKEKLAAIAQLTSTPI